MRYIAIIKKGISFANHKKVRLTAEKNQSKKHKYSLHIDKNIIVRINRIMI